MSGRSLLRRYAGMAGTAIGAVAAGAAAGVATERKLVARTVVTTGPTTGRRRPPLEARFGSLRSKPRTVVADDTVELYAEVDEPDINQARAGAALPTLIFVHGYALNLDCWHFQRAALRGTFRLVFYDQRSHGRSGRSRSEHCTIDQLGRDLAAVIDTLAPDGPVVLVGHSMGGMTIMALADDHPGWFGSRVAAVALLSTSAGGLTAGPLNLPGMSGRLAHKISPAVMATLARAPGLVEGSRRAGSDLGFLFTRAFGFGGSVPPEVVDFADEMLAATPFEVIADFYPGFDDLDLYRALAAFARVPTLLLCGRRDAITPVSHSRRMAQRLPSADFVEFTGAGHMVLLERPDEVSAALLALVDRAGAAG